MANKRLLLELVEKRMSGKESWKKVLSLVPGTTFPLIGENLEFVMDEVMGADSHPWH